MAAPLGYYGELPNSARSHRVIIKPKVRGFICVTAHPVGCERNVLEQIAITKAAKHAGRRPQARAGHRRLHRLRPGLAHHRRVRLRRRHAGRVLRKAQQPREDRHRRLVQRRRVRQGRERGRPVSAKSINGDAFANETRAKAIEIIKAEMGGKIDLVVYSLASPVRKLPDTGEVVRSALKTIGEPFHNTSVDTNKDTVIEATIEPATEQEITDTVTVMGGEDWALWIDALSDAGVLADHAKTIAYSYIGTEITWPMYWHGTLGQAKQHLDNTAKQLRSRHPGLRRLRRRDEVRRHPGQRRHPGDPAVRVHRLQDHEGEGHPRKPDRAGQPPVPRSAVSRRWRGAGDRRRRALAAGRLGAARRRAGACKTLWPTVTTENLREITDYAGYKHEFLKLFGFDREDVDYEAEVEADRRFDCLEG